MGAAQRHDKEQPVLLVLEEQVLGVPAGQLALQLGAFRHREHRLVLERLGGDAELGEAGKQVLSGGGHGAVRSCAGGRSALRIPSRWPRAGTMAAAGVCNPPPRLPTLGLCCIYP